jgi:hypothetical protein
MVNFRGMKEIPTEEYSPENVAKWQTGWQV